MTGIYCSGQIIGKYHCGRGKWYCLEQIHRGHILKTQSMVNNIEDKKIDQYCPGQGEWLLW